MLSNSENVMQKSARVCLKIPPKNNLLYYFRHPCVRAAGVDPVQPVPGRPAHRLVPRHPPLRHGVRRHPLRVGRADLRRRSPISLPGLSGVPGPGSSVPSGGHGPPGFPCLHPLPPLADQPRPLNTASAWPANPKPPQPLAQQQQQQPPGEPQQRGQHEQHGGQLAGPDDVRDVRRELSHHDGAQLRQLAPLEQQRDCPRHLQVSSHQRGQGART